MNTFKVGGIRVQKTIPFKKDIEFDSIAEIKSISLEHTLSLKENLVSGSFIVSGTYKMTDSSINLDEFSFDLPFNISIDNKYDVSNIKIDINDFYYELKNNNTLSVSIEVLIDNLEIKEESSMRKEYDALEEELSEEIEENLESISKQEDNIIKDDLDKEETSDKDEDEIREKTEESEVISSIFDNVSDSENYVTYKVHVVTESDTIETILQKYEVTLSKLEDYNDLTELKTGDKVIIPS